MANRLSGQRNRTRIVLLGTGAALAVCFLAWRWSTETVSSAATVPKPPQAIPITTAVATTSDVPIYQEGLGTVQAFYTVTVTARVDGQLQKVGFVEGQTVKKGDFLAQIDPRPNQAALELALATKAKDEAQLANAKRDLERYRILAPQDLATKQTLDTQQALVGQLEAQIKGDQATIDNARTQLAYTTITSPIQGRTGIRLVDPGNNVHATDTTGIVVVTQMQPISIIFTLPEDVLLAVNRALAAGPVTVIALSQDDKTVLDQGKVELIDNQIDQTTGTLRIKAIFPNPHNTLWPGEFVNVRVLMRIERHVVTVPSIAIQRGPDGMFVYIVNSHSTVEVRPIQAGTEYGASTVVASGVRDGERVATSNLYRLQPGAHVRIAGHAA